MTDGRTWVGLLASVVVGAWSAVAGADPLLRALLVLVLLDVGTGVPRAALEGRLNSDASWRGGLKKLAVFAAVGLATVLDGVVTLGEPGALRGATIAFYCATEALSVVENLGLLGLPVPGQMRRALEAFREASEKGPAGKGAGR